MTLKSCSVLFTAALFAMSTVQIASAQDQQIDCDDEANAEEEVCLGLPPSDDPITNFVPLIAPLVGAGLLAAAGGSGGTSSTTATTSTTSTTSTTTTGTN